MKVLIVDDSSEKIGKIRNILQETSCFDRIDLDFCLDVKNARLKLSSVYYDLLILDLNIPENIGELPNMDEGIGLVDEIIETTTIYKPTDIIVLSAFDASLKCFKNKVEKSGFVIIQYNETSKEWSNILKSKVEYISICLSQRRYIPKPPECDVLIITAVKIESNAVKKIANDWQSVQIVGDPTIYNTAVLTDKNGKDVHLIHVELPEMGMTSAASITTKAIIEFSPKIVIMVGIAAGLGKDIELGDIIVATDVWNYSSGKYEETGSDKSVVLRPDSKHILLNSALESRLKSIDYNEILENIKNTYDGKPVNTKLSVNFGQMACGGAVVASEELVSTQVKAHARKVLGLDMESYGVCFASELTTNPEISALIIKSVSDFADSHKGDKVQEYASYTSSQFAKYIIANLLDFN